MRCFKFGIAFFLGGALVVASLRNAAFAGPLRTVALSGRQAPGTSANFGDFFPPTLNAAGETAFWARLAGAGIDETNDAGLWTDSSGNLELIARTGDRAPGTPSGVRYRLFLSWTSAPTPTLNASGQIPFHALLTGSGVDTTNNKAIWSFDAGNVRLVTRTGTQAPDTPSGVQFSSSSFSYAPLSNDNGTIVFKGYLAGVGVDFSNDSGIWLDDAGNVQMVARAGDHAPGTPSGTRYDDFDRPLFNPNGELAFQASLAGSGVDHTNDSGVWSGGAGALRLVVRSGDHAQGTPSGVAYQSLGGVTLNGAGRTAFIAELTGSGIDMTNDAGLWSEGSGTLSLIAREGSQAPGTPDGVYFRDRLDGMSSFEYPFTIAALNADGRMVFLGDLSGTGVNSENDEGIWLEDSGGLELIARTGSPAPGTPDGVTFRQLSPPAINAADQIAFRAVVTGPGIDTSNNDGIWATDANGVLRLVARSGDTVEVAPLDFRTLSGISVVTSLTGESSGNEDARPSWFNDQGQIAFSAGFTDRSGGIFVSDALAVPEPATTIPVILAICGANILHQRRPIRSGQK